MKKWAVVVLVVAVVAGCGIEWFPDDSGSSSPNKITFGGVLNPCGVTPSSPVTSTPIQVFGLLTSATISVTGDAGRFSKYSLNEGEFTDTPGIIPKGQANNTASVRLQHLAAPETATTKFVFTTLTVGGKPYFWKSTTDPCVTGTNGTP